MISYIPDSVRGIFEVLTQVGNLNMHNRLKIIVECWDFMDPDKRVTNKSELTASNNPSSQELLAYEIEQRDTFQNGQETEMYTAYMEGFSDKEMPLWSKFWHGDRDVMRRRNV